jgi:hypothetical protein
MEMFINSLICSVCDKDFQELSERQLVYKRRACPECRLKERGIVIDQGGFHTEDRRCSLCKHYSVDFKKWRTASWGECGLGYSNPCEDEYSKDGVKYGLVYFLDVCDDFDSGAEACDSES